MSTIIHSVCISGYGDIGQRVARYWLAQAASVFALCRRERDDNGIQFINVDLDQPIQALPAFDAVYHFMPPPTQGDRDPRLQRFLSALSAAPKKMLLISTSAVYGDCDGAWVDENSPVNPTSERGKRRADSERQWQQWAQAQQCEWIILRVPGIYGPGRLPLERIENAVPMVEESAAPYTNRIHSEDLARIAYLAIKEDRLHGVYNVSDGQPGNMTQYFNAVADAAGLARPPLISLEQAQQQLSAGMLSYLSESRRLKIDKFLTDSGYRFLYPDLASGLAASLNHQARGR